MVHIAMIGPVRRLVCLITATACLAFAPAIPASAAAATHTVRLVTFNIYKDLDHPKWRADWNRFANLTTRSYSCSLSTQICEKSCVT